MTEPNLVAHRRPVYGHCVVCGENLASYNDAVSHAESAHPEIAHNYQALLSAWVSHVIECPTETRIVHQGKE